MLIVIKVKISVLNVYKKSNTLENEKFVLCS